MNKPRSLIAAIPVVVPTRWQFSLMLLVALLLLAACSIVQPRRDDPTPCAMGGACDDAMIEHADRYRLGYVQFDDSGHYAQPGQIEQVLNDIRATSGDGLILVAFTHGWKENAGADRWSVTGFKSILAAIAAREQKLASTQARAPRMVAGVFLGWPGHVSTLPGLNGFTWFDRADAAKRIARADFGDALLRLRQLRDETSRTDGSTANQLMLVGHSLGAAMLYQRLAQEPLRSPGAVLTPIADLVVLLSPAIPAAEVRDLTNLPAADRSVLPPVMAITSAGDVTLRVAFPLAAWVDRQDNSEDAGELPRYQAMGTYAPLITHRLEQNGTRLSLESTGARSDEGALMQISAGESVMQGHKDINNPQLVGFIADVAALQLDNRLSRTALASAFPNR